MKRVLILAQELDKISSPIIEAVRRSLFGLALLIAASSWLAPAYVRNQTFEGNKFRRDDFGNIQFRVNDQTAAGLENTGGEIVISAGSSPVEAMQAALDSWSAMDSSEVRFLRLTSTPSEEARPGGEHVVTFADTTANRAVVRDAVAVTVMFWNRDGVITGTDILFNPAHSYSTNLEPGTFDIQATMTHEAGHALGLDHSGIIGASMFPVASRASHALARLSSDDKAFAAAVYPKAVNRSNFASLQGSVKTAQGTPVSHALVVAQSTSRNIVVGSLTDGGLSGAGGNYEIASIPPGSYVIWAEPLDGPLDPSQLAAAGFGANTFFRTNFLGGAGSPKTIILLAGTSRREDLTVEAGAPTLDLEGAGGALVGSTVTERQRAVLERGLDYDIEIYGEGLDDPALNVMSLSFLGRGLAVVAGIFERDTIGFDDGTMFPLLRFRVSVATDAPVGLVSLKVTNASEMAILSGGFEIIETLGTPVIESGGIVNAASFLPRGVSAGEIFSIFGMNLGPSEGLSANLHPVTGGLETMTGAVSVSVNGLPAPLLFVSGSQINGLMPADVPGTGVALVSVRYRQVQGEALSVALLAVNPGVFTFPLTTRAIVLNHDGSLNDPARSAPRGTFVSIFGTGQGPVEPSLATGELAGGGDRLSVALEPARVRIGGATAPVTFTGMAPGFAGLFQVNALVPANAPAGEAVSLELEISGVAAQEGVTIAVE